jgi:hypothetical protein
MGEGGALMAQMRDTRLWSSVLCMIASLVPGSAEAAKIKPRDRHVVTEAELQLELMDCADRYDAVVAQAVDEVERMDVPPDVRRATLGGVVVSAAAKERFPVLVSLDPDIDTVQQASLETDLAVLEIREICRDEGIACQR